MKGKNPIVPSGINFEGASRGRSNMRMAVIAVVLLHVALFTAILFNACKQKEEEASEGAGGTSAEKTAHISIPQPTPLPQPPPSLEESLPPLPSGSALPPMPSTVGESFSPTPIQPSKPVVPSGLAELATAPQPVVPTATDHIVASGENFWTISKKYGVSAKSVENANPNVIPTRMKIGQKINIPAKTIVPLNSVSSDDGKNYTVKSGDTLGHIALKHGVKLGDLTAANPNIIPTRMKIGQKILLPTVASASDSSAIGTSPPVDPETGLPIAPGFNR